MFVLDTPMEHFHNYLLDVNQYTNVGIYINSNIDVTG